MSWIKNLQCRPRANQLQSRTGGARGANRTVFGPARPQSPLLTVIWHASKSKKRIAIIITRIVFVDGFDGLRKIVV